MKRSFYTIVAHAPAWRVETLSSIPITWVPSGSGICNLSESGNIGKILRSSGCQFRGDQILDRNEWRCDSAWRVNYDIDPIFPGALKINPVDMRQDGYHDRRASHAKELSAIREIVRSEPFERRPKLGERGIHRCGVAGVRLDEKVDILGRPRLGMK